MSVQGTLSSPIREPFCGKYTELRMNVCGRGRFLFIYFFFRIHLVSQVGCGNEIEVLQPAADKQMENKSVVKQENERRERPEEGKQFGCCRGRLARKSLLSFSEVTLCRLSVLQLCYRSLHVCLKEQVLL